MRSRVDDRKTSQKFLQRLGQLIKVSWNGGLEDREQRMNLLRFMNQNRQELVMKLWQGAMVKETQM